jgi:dipeptidyl aminopeptidase/acylaminoacyl peptidase
VAGLEDRLAAVVLVVAGAWEATSAPDHPRLWRSHPLNFAPRITAPTLMVNATRDEYTRRDEAAELHEALRVSRRLAWHKSEHSIPVAEQKKDVLKWLDRYLR